MVFRFSGQRTSLSSGEPPTPALNKRRPKAREMLDRDSDTTPRRAPRQRGPENAETGAGGPLVVGL